MGNLPTGASMQCDETNPEIFAEIDENLRRAYEDLLNESLPDRFQILIQRLREKDEGLETSFGDGENP